MGKRKSFYGVLTKLGFELVTVIAGILIALFFNNLQERKHDREVLMSTLSSLSKEFDKNIENIERIQQRLERFRDTLHFYEKDKRLSIYDLTIKAPGLTTADLFTTNWQVTLSSNSLRLLDFSTVTLLSQIDAKHLELKEQSETLTAIVYSPALYKTDQEGFEYRRVLGEWIGAYLNNEKELIALYNKFDKSISVSK